ncbi:MAG TPA: ATP-binding protein [Jatrophihabitans sp.]|jgi:signal transduction histidine kinase
MSRIREQLLPIIAGALVIVVGVSVVLLLRVANNQGIDALTRAKLQQVQTTADSFNARVSSQLGAVTGLGGLDWQLTPNSKSDMQKLQTYNVDPTATSGFYLINSDDKVTEGILLRKGMVGSTFDPPGWEKAKQQLAATPLVFLPVTQSGKTTDLPSYDLVVAIRGATSTSVRGALVFESAVTDLSPFQQEISQLADHAASTAAWFFIDSRGAVVATTQNTGLGEKIDHAGYYLHAAAGLSYRGDQIVFTAPVPVIHWHVVFRQDRGQFESGVSGPLQEAGLILVLLLLAVGLTLVVILVRRLREAREQERRLRELTRSQSEFISVVSHELRTPVAGVLGFLQTTLDHWETLSDAERLNTVRRAVTNARRLQAMTRDVLDTDSIESGRIVYSFQRVDLGAELETAVAGSREADPSHLVIVDETPEPALVEADPDRLQQVLTNLLENAHKNSPVDEPITVETSVVDAADGPKVRVAVVDRGPGVSPDSLERIFEKFVRGNDAAVTGTGLGLYIVRTIVEAHHGRIWCESNPGQRTAFIFELPLVDVAAPTRL